MRTSRNAGHVVPVAMFNTAARIRQALPRSGTGLLEEIFVLQRTPNQFERKSVSL
jgi:hypothetical protein